METLIQIKQLLQRLNEIGDDISYDNTPQIKDVKIFEGLLDENKFIKRQKYNEKDKYGLEYKEVLTRYLFLNAILDQGPDMEGVRLLQTRVTNELYDKGISFLHDPHLFFKNINVVFRVIEEEHTKIKKERSIEWARRQNANASRYNLFLDNSKQLSSYVLGRWAPPLSIIQIRINEGKNLLDLFKEQKSAETLSSFIKSDTQYGVGKAIGNKAAHLLVKWLIYSYGLIESTNPKWSNNSYELPFDSNAGRVLFMTGFFHYFFPSLNNIFIDKDTEKKWIGSRMNQKFSKEIGKNGEWTGKYHMYITNSFRNAIIEENTLDEETEEKVKIFLKEKFGIRPQKIKIQHLINYFSEVLGAKIGAIDDGLMKIGTSFCINRGNQRCNSCPLKDMCCGKYDEERRTKFFT